MTRELFNVVNEKRGYWFPSLDQLLVRLYALMRHILIGPFTYIVVSRMAFGRSMGLSYWLLYAALGILAFTYFVDPRAVSNFRIALLLKPYCTTHPQDCQSLLGGSNYGLETREFDHYDMIYLRPWILSQLDKFIIGGMYWIMMRFCQSGTDVTYTLETFQIGLAAFYVTIVMISRFILTSKIWLLCFMGIAASIIDSWMVVMKPIQIAAQMWKCVN